MKKRKKAAEATVLCFKTESGKVALSPRLTWIKMNMRIINPKPMNKPMIREEFHAYTVPPHWSAKMRHTTELMSIQRYNCIIRNEENCTIVIKFVELFTERHRCERLFRRRQQQRNCDDCNSSDGEINIEANVKMDQRAISYHHLQETCCVNAPPARGPATEAMALAPMIEARKRGLCRKGTI